MGQAIEKERRKGKTAPKWRSFQRRKGKKSRLTNGAHVDVLPSSWGTLYELTKLDDEAFRAACERRLGEMMEEQRETTGLNGGGRPSEKTRSRMDPVSSRPTLAAAGKTDTCVPSPSS